MKKTLLLLSLFLSYQTSVSQCARAAENFGNNITSGYDISGDVTVTLNTNNSVTLDLGSNFNTSNGPDIRAYLVNSNGMTISQLQNADINNLENIEFGLVGCLGCNPLIPSSGTKSFTVAVPNGVNILDYDTVFFYCLEFDAFWDFGTYTPFTNGVCTLSIENNLISNVSIAPNPASNIIHINSTINKEAKIEIFNILGKKVYSHSGLINKDIDTSNFKSGLYILTLVSENQKTSKKLIIE